MLTSVTSASSAVIATSAATSSGKPGPPLLGIEIPHRGNQRVAAPARMHAAHRQLQQRA